jgi:hypothetical protein
MFTTKVADVSDITEIKGAILKNCYHAVSHTKKMRATTEKSVIFGSSGTKTLPNIAAF